MGDDADAQSDVHVLVRPPIEAAAGRSVQREDGEPVGIAPDGVRERTSVGSLQHPQRLTHEWTSIRLAPATTAAPARASFDFFRGAGAVGRFRKSPGYRLGVVQDPQRIDLSLEPLDDYVVIQPSDEEAETKTGLIIPASAESPA